MIGKVKLELLGPLLSPDLRTLHAACGVVLSKGVTGSRLWQALLCSES
jgi:hypothetical protein